jgi:S1-C subfamily serine protease
MRLAVVVLLGLLLAPVAAEERDVVREVAERSFPSVVKLHGASGFARLPSYGTAVLVHPDGIALTARSVMLETESLRAVLHDGTRRKARIVARDDEREMVAIRIEGPGPFPHLKPIEPGEARVGQWVLSIGNAFRLADGDERPSVNLGLLAAVTRLDLRLGLSDRTVYRGRVYLTDANVNPGSAGGAMVGLDGRLLGVLGRVLESRATRTLVSHAIPIEDLAPLIDRAVKGEPHEARREERPPGRHGIRPFRFGLHRSPPAYVDRVDGGSPAAKAGLRKNDLILRVGEVTVPTIRAFLREMKRFHAGDEVVLTVKRGTTVLKLKLVLDAPRKGGER